MTQQSLAEVWSEHFGLARSPLFQQEFDTEGGVHSVLLDGGLGSFGMSVVDELPDPKEVAGWAWSSDIPHHVTVAKERVQVVRWDAAHDAQVYSLESVQRDLSGFYRYLCRDKLRSNRTVVRHLVNLFGRIRSLVAHKELSDQRSIDAFVTVLADLIADNDQPVDVVAFGLPTDANELLSEIAGPSLEEALYEIRTAPSSLSALRLHPNLAIRHAGGQLFQEAHFDLVRAPAPDLFGYMDPAVLEPRSRGGTHFTPPALARSIVDHTLAQVTDLKDRASLVISDPACGSAAFLHEALRGLNRSGFEGELRIVGRDISESAISMARFTLSLALRDWTPQGGASLDLEIKDSLRDDAFPSADITVMNPPFISVIAQSPEQKAKLREVVGAKAGSRGDYSMAFVTRALDALADKGVMGTLFPANLLTLEAATPWRQRLAAEGDIRLLASIGDFGLFSQALVHVACAVISKGGAQSSNFTALITGNESGTTGEALRELRKTHGIPPKVDVEETGWKLFSAEAAVLERQLPWRILTPRQRRIVDTLEARQTPTVNDLFEISQGVQTGNLKVFLFNEEEFQQLSLPAKEKRYFRDAVMTDSIEDGRIIKTYFMFFPHHPQGTLFESEEELRSSVPTYYRKVLEPNEQKLRERASIVRSKRKDWWGLMHPRTGTFAFDERPRIISKFFGAEGSFVLDEAAQFLPSTGHVWSPKDELLSSYLSSSDSHSQLEGAYEAATIELMRAYVTILNSRPFIRLASFRSVTIAGGQYDLSKRFISRVYLPNLWEKSLNPMLAEYVRELARHSNGAKDRSGNQDSHIDRIVARLYGVPELAEE